MTETGESYTLPSWLAADSGNGVVLNTECESPLLASETLRDGPIHTGLGRSPPAQPLGLGAHWARTEEAWLSSSHGPGGTWWEQGKVCLQSRKLFGMISGYGECTSLLGCVNSLF